MKSSKNWKAPPLLSSLLMPGHSEGSRYHFWDVQRAPSHFLPAPGWFHTPTRCFVPHSFPRSHIPAPGTFLVPLEVRFVPHPMLQAAGELDMFLFIPRTSDTCRDKLKVLPYNLDGKKITWKLPSKILCEVVSSKSSQLLC